ncbi:hypothetical protein P2T68_02895 [Pseudomonas sp. G11]|uniref:hypothetical protein n=1 Tax=Pseudomonas sp. G11 TaxID=528343 RepID=UPI0024026817|nr:hypothetical protein [Pseudomonas sp. G11]WEX16294.1 hypothetical protein P2T68_02895 [Pseudomonas sp. G11]
MRIFVAALGLLILAGCVGPSELAKNKPSITVSTSKSPKAYALCVFPKWQAARTDSSMVETETGYRLLVASNNMADELLEINKSSSGSKVALYQRMAWSMMMGREAIESSVRSCL